MTKPAHIHTESQSHAALELKSLQEAALSELHPDVRESVIRTTTAFITELQRPGVAHGGTELRYAKSIGVRRQFVKNLVEFLRRHTKCYVGVSVFGPTDPGVWKLSRECNVDYFVRLEVIVPLAIALISPEISMSSL